MRRHPRLLRAIPAVLLAIVVSAAGLALAPSPSSAANPVVTVDLSAGTGAVMHGATGWLYGLAYDNRPGPSMMAGLKPQYTGQKAPGGLQHADGDAFEVAPDFLQAGGKAVMIYMQDDYAQWPYPNNGVNEYLNHVSAIANKVKANPNRSSFIYVPFNEPDWIWYAPSGAKLTQFLNDWKLVYQRIRSIDPSAVIAGPNFLSYNSAALRSFFTFAKNNQVVPQMTTWHALDDAYFTNWYANYDDYRRIESDLGIGRLPVNINEYGRQNRDLGVPGNLVQYLARFETSKVYACMAYWTPAGTLNELLTPGGTAKASAWYLYNWYGTMTGTTVRTTLPSQNGALQALASIDGNRQQSSVILGGAGGSTDVVVKGFSSTSFGNTVTVTVAALANSGAGASNGPTQVSRTTATVSNGQITVTVPNMAAANAYNIVVTAGGGGGSFDPARTYQVTNRKSGKALEVYPGNSADGTAVDQRSSTGAANQRWYLQDAGGGYLKVINAGSGKALDVNQASTADGAPAIQWTYSGSANQQWSVVDVGGGYYRLTARHSGKSLDVTGGSVADGAAVIQWPYAGGTNQQWTIRP
ncbi:RICIN domain-containing protein [Micromonospora sp. 067-2]|uniref:RICIN domain-containing protein n=1 Tax=Micromonospora sp. 067-2 TaxID=2789270 RepID=UPI0039784690